MLLENRQHKTKSTYPKITNKNIFSRILFNLKMPRRPTNDVAICFQIVSVLNSDEPPHTHPSPNPNLTQTCYESIVVELGVG